MFLSRISTVATAVISAIVLATNNASAELTKFDTEYDGYTVMFKTSLGTIRSVVEAQDDVWIWEQFNVTNDKLVTAIDAGEIKMGTYLSEVTAFYELVNTKYINFASITSAAFDANPINLLDYNQYATDAWSDFLFDSMTSAATDLKMDAALQQIAALQQEIEKDIKANESPSTIEGKFADFYLTADSELISRYDEKRNEFGQRYQNAADNTAIEKIVATPAPSPSPSPSATPQSSATAVGVVSVAFTVGLTVALSTLM